MSERRFSFDGDFNAISRGGNVTATTMFGVRICSLARLREMKQAQSRAQDRLDLENLPEE